MRRLGRERGQFITNYSDTAKVIQCLGHWHFFPFFLLNVRQAEAVATSLREAPIRLENEHAVKAGGQLLLQQFLYCAELSTEAEGS